MLAERTRKNEALQVLHELLAAQVKYFDAMQVRSLFAAAHETSFVFSLGV